MGVAAVFKQQGDMLVWIFLAVMSGFIHVVDQFFVVAAAVYSCCHVRDMLVSHEVFIDLLDVIDTEAVSLQKRNKRIHHFKNGRVVQHLVYDLAFIRSHGLCVDIDGCFGIKGEAFKFVFAGFGFSGDGI